MTTARGLKGLGWFGGCMVVTLGFYLVSLQVAAERKRLEQLDAKIGAAERDIRAMETEFDTRASLAQLERWNGDTLSLVAPTAAQFVRGEAQLAAISFRPLPPGRGATGEVRTAALVVPAFTTQLAAPAVPVARPASSVTVKVAAASVAKVAPNKPAVSRPAVVIAAAKPVARKMQTVAMLDHGLLSESTLGDLVSGARGEARRLR